MLFRDLKGSESAQGYPTVRRTSSHDPVRGDVVFLQSIAGYRESCAWVSNDRPNHFAPGPVAVQFP